MSLQHDGMVIESCAPLGGSADKLPSSQPPSEMGCVMDPCQYSYAYAYADWSPCSATCGQGMQIRMVACQKVSAPGAPSAVVSDALCSGTKAATSQVGAQQLPAYRWPSCRFRMMACIPFGYSPCMHACMNARPSGWHGHVPFGSCFRPISRVRPHV